MWNNAELKKNAKVRMKSYQGKAIVVSLIVAILASLEYLNVNNFFLTWLDGRFFEISPFLKEDAISNTLQYFAQPLIGVNIFEYLLKSKNILIWVGILLLIRGMFFCFITGPIRYGQASFYYKNRYEETGIDELFSAFNMKNYFNITKTMFFMYIQLLAFTCLLIVPGIIYTYAYYLVPYILIENPNMPAREVLSLSKKMTEGYKSNMFGLTLSFFGWMVLGTLTAGLSDVVFTTPYRMATDVELYFELKKIYEEKMEPTELLISET